MMIDLLQHNPETPLSPLLQNAMPSFYTPSSMAQSDTDFYILGLASSNKIEQDDRLDDVYHDFFGKAATFVQRNSGNLEDAKTVFQETIMALMYKVWGGNFSLKARLGTYLHSVWRNVWFSILKKQKPHLLLDNMPERTEEVSFTKEKDSTLELYTKLYQLIETEKMLTQKQKELLVLILEGNTNQEIAEQREMKENAVAQAKRKLFLKLGEMIPRLFPTTYTNWKYN